MILEARNLSFRYHNSRMIFSDVNFDIAPGEVLSIIGINGAGKSTLMKILNGNYKKDEGQILIDGKEVDITDPLVAAAHGISIIFQELNLVDQLSIAENIFAGRLSKGLKRVNWKEINRKAKELLDRIGFDADPRTEVGSLTVAGKQMVEIAKALSRDCRIILMDEPSATLTKKELNALFDIIRDLKKRGIAVIYISHRMEEIFEICETATVMRDGRIIGTVNVGEVSSDRIVEMMVGREVSDLFPKPEVKPGEEVLRVENLSRTGFFRDVSFRVRAGEIVGLTGLVGAGRTEVVQTIFGVEHYDAGKVFVDGKEVHIRRPQDAMRLGIGLLTEDRQNQGLILDWGIGRNITLPELGAKFSKKGGITSETIENQAAKELAEEIDVKAVTVFDPASSLSGGNQQKVVVAKALASDLKLLIMDEPTANLDYGNQRRVMQQVRALADGGYTILLSTHNPEHALHYATQVLALQNGRVIADGVTADTLTPELLARLYGIRAEVRRIDGHTVLIPLD